MEGFCICWIIFLCTQHGAARPDVHSVVTSSRLDAIRSVYGVSVARNLIKIDASDSDSSNSVFSMDGFISNSNYIAKKTIMVLFINGMYLLLDSWSINFNLVLKILFSSVIIWFQVFSAISRLEWLRLIIFLFK